MLSGRKPGNALDVGMGQGRNTIWLAEQGWRVTGFDISPVAIAQAKQQAERRRLRIEASSRCSWQGKNYRDGEFTCWGVGK